MWVLKKFRKLAVSVLRYTFSILLIDIINLTFQLPLYKRVAHSRCLLSCATAVMLTLWNAINATPIAATIWVSRIISACSVTLARYKCIDTYIYFTTTYANFIYLCISRMPIVPALPALLCQRVAPHRLPPTHIAMWNMMAVSPHVAVPQLWRTNAAVMRVPIVCFAHPANWRAVIVWTFKLVHVLWGFRK